MKIILDLDITIAWKEVRNTITNDKFIDIKKMQKFQEYKHGAWISS